MTNRTKLLQNYTSLFFRISDDDDLMHFDRLIQGHPEIAIFDALQSQLCDLIRIRNPSRQLDEDEVNSLVLNHLGEQMIEEYGVWVCYPWCNKVVRILDEKEFIEVKTSRNKNKITKEEQDLLATKKIGVVGLSVGQSVATTLAMERTAGELRIADFDNLSLTNCNRLRTPLYNLGLPKAIITAREIAELDPYLKVSCFEKGVTAENIDSFIFDGGKLDLIIDECDSVEIKVLLRQKAKEHGIPVLMEMSDRGMIDVERFDLNPELKINLGRIEGLDLNNLDRLTPAEKVAFLSRMVDGENISTRLKESIAEMGKTLNTWPQLASAVVLGGGACADVSRRVLLGHHKNSGRYYVDLEQIIN